MIATMLDARHKHLGFLPTSERLAANAKLHEIASAVVLTGSHTENPNSGVSQSGQQAQAGGDDGKRALRMLLGGNYNERCINDSESEVNNSLGEQPPSLDKSTRLVESECHQVSQIVSAGKGLLMHTRNIRPIRTHVLSSWSDSQQSSHKTNSGTC